MPYQYKIEAGFTTVGLDLNWQGRQNFRNREKLLTDFLCCQSIAINVWFFCIFANQKLKYVS